MQIRILKMLKIEVLGITGQNAHQFDDSLKDVILNHAGRWILEEKRRKNIYNQYSGIINTSASVNAKLKIILIFKEQRLDNMVLLLCTYKK